MPSIQDVFGLPRHLVTVTNEGLWGFPTKNGIHLAVTVTVCGVVPEYARTSNAKNVFTIISNALLHMA